MESKIIGKTSASSESESKNNEPAKVFEVKKKKEFSRLPDRIVARVLEETKGDIKETRARLRKYFGVFLTNRVIKGKDEGVLKYHLSTKKRDYDSVYSRIFDGRPYGSLIDIGCGVNGFTFSLLHKLGIGRYMGIEASGQIVEAMNNYFDKAGFGEVADCIWLDIFKVDEVLKIIKEGDKPRMIFLFQVIDALETFEKNFSKTLLSKIFEVLGIEDRVVISLSTQSLNKGRKFNTSRAWLVEFLNENFKILDDWAENGERFLVIRKK